MIQQLPESVVSGRWPI